MKILVDAIAVAVPVGHQALPLPQQYPGQIQRTIDSVLEVAVAVAVVVDLLQK